MPRKQSGGSPASTNVNNMNQGYLKALEQVPVGGQVHGLPGCQAGGSLASDRVHSLLSSEGCPPNEIPMGQVPNADPSRLALYKTSGGGSRRRVKKRSGRRSSKRRFSKRTGKKQSGGRGKKRSFKKRHSKKRSGRKQRAGGSDWSAVQYARGPVNNPDRPDLFSKFAGPYDQFISNEKLFMEGLGKGSASNFAPFPFPQKGGRSYRRSKSKSKGRKNVKRRNRSH